MRLKLNIAFYLLFILAFPIFSQEKINHDNDVWYQLILIPVEEERDPYTFEWIWHNTSWRDVIGFVEPRKMLNGSFKMSDFVFMNPSSRMGRETENSGRQRSSFTATCQHFTRTSNFSAECSA